MRRPRIKIRLTASPLGAPDPASAAWSCALTVVGSDCAEPLSQSNLEHSRTNGALPLKQNTFEQISSTQDLESNAQRGQQYLVPLSQFQGVVKRIQRPKHPDLGLLKNMQLDLVSIATTSSGSAIANRASNPRTLITVFIAIPNSFGAQRRLSLTSD